MNLSDAFWLAAAFAVLCAYYIGEKIIDIDFSCFPREKPEKGEVREGFWRSAKRRLRIWGCASNIRNAFEKVLVPPRQSGQKTCCRPRMDMTFRRNIERQIDSLARNSLYR